MNREERPIVFTITSNSNSGMKHIIKTSDARVSEEYYSGISYFGDLFNRMQEISAEYNNKGYAVLFEVD